MTRDANPFPGPAVKTDVSVPAWRANLIALGLMPILAVTLSLLYWLMWGSVPFTGDGGLLLRPLVLIPVAAVSVIAHEALHAIGFVRFGRLSRSAVRFGMHWKALAPYAHCKEPMPASAYRRSTLLPALVLGALPCAGGGVLGLGWLYTYGILMLAVASGDFTVYWVIRGIAGDACVMDHPRRPGCWVLDDEMADSPSIQF